MLKLNNGTLYIIICGGGGGGGGGGGIIDMHTSKLLGLKSKTIKETATHFKTPQGHTTMMMARKSLIITELLGWF